MGQYLADWICGGEAPYELLEFDPLRYGAWTSMDYAVAKTRQAARVDMSRYIYPPIYRESYGLNTALGFPHEERQAGRPANRPRPLHDTLGEGRGEYLSRYVIYLW